MIALAPVRARPASGIPQGGMRAAPLLLVAPLALGASGCGALLQTIIGFEEETTRPATRTRSVRFEGLPADATVERTTADGRVQAVRRTAGDRDEVTFAVEETVSVPKSRWPLWLGTGLDLATTAIFLATTPDTDEGVALRGLGTFYVLGPALIGDAVLALIFSFDDEETVERYRVDGPATVTYTARAGGEVRTTTVDVAWQDRAQFDFSAPGPAPGGPRLP